MLQKNLSYMKFLIQLYLGYFMDIILKKKKNHKNRKWLVNILKVGCVLLFKIFIIKKLAVKTLTVTFKLLIYFLQPIVHKKDFASFL